MPYVPTHSMYEDCTVDMVLPTGAMGNITGGYMAKLVGIPIGRLCAAVNTNGKILYNAKLFSAAKQMYLILWVVLF